MLYIFMIILLIGEVVLFGLMLVTTNNLNFRITRNEEYLKVVSDDFKQIKMLLKREVAMANSEAYPVVQGHVDYKTYDESGQ